MNRVATAFSALLLGAALSFACAHSEEHSAEPAEPQAASAPSAPGANACTAASDCHGMLPHHCLQCADGSSACAHWACVEGACQVVTCPAGDAGSAG